MFAIYGLVVVSYIVGRFVLSVPYRPAPDVGLAPSVAIVMPAFNEEEVIAGSLRSLLELDYPAEKLDLVAVDDGSTDETLARMREVAASSPRVRVIALGENQWQAGGDGGGHARHRRGDLRLRRLRQLGRAATPCTRSCRTSPTRRSARFAGTQTSRTPTSRG